MIKPRFKIRVNNLIFIDVVWFKRQGIVATQDLVTNEIYFYIGLEDTSKFIHEEQDDIREIMSYGAKFPNDAGELLFKHINFKKFNYKQMFPENLI